ncbi:preprotein translocase subunit SecG [Parasphaerochaeta coccoides]|uniref:Protein-export membrane protein SecG n=1 Tax=Parasphaerochaeta coccoides (strain ATCC BAA-1237 / DSM 17374 / SPN1) TaxID=760011 RepID=F4GJ62_PARC1|nr:preprotein translocase subunit SecG [Parasphaerochaeta coccoides]AEC01702.1 preprotein translocase, SecG subunit [Parasphaerochaeta coccoides DSM 17374]
MVVLSIILTVFFVIASVVLVILVGLQSEGGTGLGGIFGGGSDTAFGAKSNSVVTRITAIVAASFMVLALVVALLNKSSSRDYVLETLPVQPAVASEVVEEWWNAAPPAPEAALSVVE